MRIHLPIDDVLPQLLTAIAARGAAVLIAPPGAGKTTRVPGALLDAGLAGEGSILVLQPRRVAARSAARRIAHERGSDLGAEVGYRVRFDARVGPETRIELLTEGLLTRRLQSDPFLDGVGCVVFDEFHERSLHSDLGLALLREVQRDVRPDLRLVVMSATLDPGPVAEWLDAPIVRAEGRAYPVDIQFDARDDDRPVPARCARAVRAALAATTEGHVLVFLPGVGEIERTATAIGASPLPGVELLPLHGRLSARDQDRALAPSPLRKVVLATNIAETSITIEGVTTVIDTGLARSPRFDPAIGLERLELGRISRASADQRTGRAGRTGPGRCHRLWTRGADRGLLARDVPAVRRADLTRTVLEIYAWGSDPRDFGWFEPPPLAHIERAEATLERLGALEQGKVTALGASLLALPAHPRLARVVVEGHRRGQLEAAATAAALAAERDLFIEPPHITGDSDLELRLDALSAVERGRTPPGVSRRRAREVAKARDQLVRVARGALGAERGARQPQSDASTIARLLLSGFPDRVAQRRGPRSARFKLANGTGARLSENSVVRDAPLIIAVNLRGARRGERSEHVIEIAAALDPSALSLEEAVVTRFDPDREAVIQLRSRRYLALELETVPAGAGADPDAVAEALAIAAAADPVRAFRWPDTPAVAGLITRLRWLARARPELGMPTFDALDVPPSPPAEPDPLIVTLCVGRRSFTDLRKLPLASMLDGLIPYPVRAQLDRLAPARMTLPDGTTKAIEYRDDGPPVLATRFERLFGVDSTPEVAGVPLMLHLLAPNRRPVQVTADLPSFWRNTYPQVRKELRGRYPKHPWPEDPLTAPPGVRRRRR